MCTYIHTKQVSYEGDDTAGRFSTVLPRISSPRSTKTQQQASTPWRTFRTLPTRVYVWPLGIAGDSVDEHQGCLLPLVLSPHYYILITGLISGKKREAVNAFFPPSGFFSFVISHSVSQLVSQSVIHLFEEEKRIIPFRAPCGQ